MEKFDIRLLRVRYATPPLDKRPTGSTNANQFKRKPNEQRCINHGGVSERHCTWTTAGDDETHQCGVTSGCLETSQLADRLRCATAPGELWADRLLYFAVGLAGYFTGEALPYTAGLFLGYRETLVFVAI